MKRIAILTTAIFLLASAIPCFAEECSVEAAFEAAGYRVGDAANISITYDTPHSGGDETIYMSISSKGLSDIRLVSADTLICTDVTCMMHHETELLEFTGSRFTLKEGYSGTIILSADIENAAQAELSAKIEYGGETVSARATASVTDYQAPAPAASPSETKTPETNAPGEDKPGTGTPATSDPENGAATAMPSTGSAGSAALGVIMCMLGAAALAAVLIKRRA